MELSLNDRRETAAAFRIMCGLCARLFDERPEAAFITKLAGNRALFLDEPFSSVAAESSRELYDVLAQAGMPGSDAFETFVTEVQRDHTYLFRMVGASHTSPYESVYRTDDHTLFGPTTLEVRASYKAHGIQAAAEGSRPDDHIANEFTFLELLLGKIADGSAGVGDEATALTDVDVADIECAIRAFLSDHVLVFAPVYLKNVQVRAQEPFYRNLAAIAEAMLGAMAAAYDAAATEKIDERDYLLESDAI